MILILKDKSQFLCSDALIKESSLLTEMETYCGNHRDLITVPEFVSRNVLSTITKMLENSPPFGISPAILRSCSMDRDLSCWISLPCVGTMVLLSCKVLQ